jgi:hypothetical protein
MDKVNKNISSIKKELEKLYKLAPISKGSELEFLRGLDSYFNFIQKEKILIKIITTMQEDSVRDSIQIIQESAQDENAKNWYESAEYMEKYSGRYPTHPYNQLLELWEEFEEVKELNTLAQISETEIHVVKKNPSGDSLRTLSGRGLITLAGIYNNLLEPLHKFLIEQLDLVQTRGIFSKYLDYSEKTSTLYFQEKEIKINIKKILSNAHYLLIYLFAHNPFEKHFCDELNDEKVLFEKNKFWKSYYDACKDIQKKVEKVTGVSDFLDFNAGKGMYVRLNPKYSLSETI